MSLLGIVESPFKAAFKGAKGLVHGGEQVLHGAGKIVPKPLRPLLPVAGAIGGAYLGGPWGAAAGAALGSELEGNRLLKSGLIGAGAGAGTYAAGELFGPGGFGTPGAGAPEATVGGAEYGVGSSTLSTDPVTGAVISNAPPEPPITGTPLPEPGMLDKIGAAASGFMKSNLAIPAAVTAGSLFLGNRPIPESGALRQEQGLSGPGINAMRAGMAGQITPSQQAQIDRWTSDQKAAARQLLINSGQGVDSSAMAEMNAKIDQGALAMKQGFSDQLFQQGVQELGISDAATQNLIGLKMQQQQRTGQALSAFLLSYGLLGGWERKAA